MERLALMSAVLLPLTLLSGIYGMNIIVNSHSLPTPPRANHPPSPAVGRSRVEAGR
jgi:hypothetical protein